MSTRMRVNLMYTYTQKHTSHKHASCPNNQMLAMIADPVLGRNHFKMYSQRFLEAEKKGSKEDDWEEEVEVEEEEVEEEEEEEERRAERRRMMMVVVMMMMMMRQRLQAMCPRGRTARAAHPQSHMWYHGI